MVEASGILACFKGAVDDPRSPSGLRHRIGPLLALCAAATLCGARGWTEMHEWIQSLSPVDARPFQMPQDRRRSRAPEHLLHSQYHDQGRSRPA